MNVHIIPNRELSIEQLKTQREAELEKMMEKNRRSINKQKKGNSVDQAD